MCGIAGAWVKKGAENLLDGLEEKLRGSIHLMAHRGPDHQAVSRCGHAVMAHARLAVIDTDSSANQPFTDSLDRSMVFNGEIYNYRELKQEMGNEPFRTHCDTEVLFKGINHEGTKFIERLNGFFAFAHYSSRSDHFILARDRLGIKPLYYSETQWGVVFASEIHLFKMLLPTLQIDDRALRLYLQFGYIPAPLSIYKDVHKLMPGEYLEAKDGIVRKIRYYMPSAHNPLPGRMNIRELLADSVEKRLVSDVPLGAFLSGGIDSAIIAALAAKKVDRLKTFSVSFPELRFLDEGPAAERTARHIGTEHISIPLRFSDMLADARKYVESLPEPFADSSGIAVYALSKKVKEHVTVALSGDGADELFAGYQKHQAWLRMMDPGLLGSIAKNGASVWKILPKSREGRFSNRVRQLDRFAGGLRLSGEDRYFYLAALQDREDVNELFNGDIGKADRESMQFFDGQIENLNEMLLADQKFVLPNDMLFKVDHASMQHALEVRVPFLDHRVVDFANQLTSGTKAVKGRSKILLRETFSDLLPPEVFQRRKQGFEVPLLSWMRGEMREELNDTLFSGKLSGAMARFDMKALEMKRKKLDSADPGNVAQHIWALYVFMKWSEE